MSISRFQALLKTYEQLTEVIVYTMRMDVRARSIHYLDLASRHVCAAPSCCHQANGVL